MEKDPEVYRFVVTAPLLDQSSGDPAAPVTGHIAAQMSLVIAEALTRAGRDTAAARVWGAGLVGMVRAAADQWLADARRDEPHPADRAPHRPGLGRALRRLARRDPLTPPELLTRTQETP